MRTGLVSVVAVLLLAGPALAQPGLRPSDERPELPETLPPERPALELPAVEPPRRDRLSRGPEVEVRRFIYVGNTAFTHGELEAVTAPWVGRVISSEELLAARDAVTRHYIDGGYITSGAVVPDQRVRGGLVVMRIVEGALTEIQVRGTDHFRPSYFRSRLEHAGRAPVNVDRIEEELQILQQDPLVGHIEAVLAPGERLGESHLSVRVVELRQYQLTLVAANDRSPSIGAAGGGFEARYANLIGVRDQLGLRTRFTEGLRDVETRWEVPVTSRDTRLGARFRYSFADVVEEPFDELDIQGEAVTAGLSVRHPLHRSRSQQLWVGLLGEWRKSRTELLGNSFCAQPEVLDCSPSVTVLRFLGDWTWRTSTDALAVRSTLSWGVDALGATTGPGNTPDGEFVAWLGQGQWAHRFPEKLLGSQILARTDVQLASDPLLALEKIAVGGLQTVRGYRENQLVRDNGVVASLEWQVPVWRVDGRPVVQLAPFWDLGHAWNQRRDLPDNTISSLGIGLIVEPTQRARAELYWGGRLIDVEREGDGLQKHGIYFYVTFDVF